MRRKKIFCFIIAAFISVLLLFITLKITTLIIGAELILMYFVYLALTSGISVSVLKVRINGATKGNIFATLSTILALLVILSFIFSLDANISYIKNISFIVFIISFIVFPIVCSKWNKYDNN